MTERDVHDFKFYKKLKEGMYIDYRYGKDTHKILKVTGITIKQGTPFPVEVIEYDTQHTHRIIENAYRFIPNDKSQKYKIITKEEAYVELL